MNVRLISITKPVIEECNTAEELVAYCARVSNPANQTNHWTAGRLLRYLIRNRHFSPLEMVDVTIEITTTRDITHQIIRHRSFRFQEFSQRYAEVSVFLDEGREARLQDNKNRQNSIKTDDADLQRQFMANQHLIINMAKSIYQWAIGAGIAKEQARIVLPEGLTISKIYMKGDLRSWLHYCQLRMDPSTQLEHREVAEACWAIICDQFPAIKDSLVEVGDD